MPKGAVTASCAIHEENTHTGTPPALSLRCLISKVTNQSLWEDFRANLVFADQKKCFSRPESHREHEAWVDLCRGDLLLLTDVKEDPVLDSTRKKEQTQELKVSSILRCPRLSIYLSNIPQQKCLTNFHGTY